jgi:dephospho-CoA kinase
MNIGITGLAGSGKDTLADILVSLSAGKYAKASFAGVLKRICTELGWDGAKDSRGRKLLQNMGMLLREYDEDTWIKLLDKSLDKNKYYVVPDVRFKNEAAYIRDNQGIIIRVSRPDLELSDTHKHVSEFGQTEIQEDYLVINDGDLENLKKELLKIILPLNLL